MKKEVVIITCAYKRPEIFRIFLDNFQFLRAQLKYEGVNLSLVVAGSEHDDSLWETHCFEIAREYKGVTWLEHENDPVGKKWNYALAYLKKLKFDVVMILGSDDLITPQFVLKGLSVLQEGYDITGVKDMYVLNSEDGEMVFWEGYAAARKGVSIGAGRMLTRELVEKANYKLWDDGLNCSLDGSTMRILSTIEGVREDNFECSERDKVLVIDVKSPVNIWKYDVWNGIPVESEDMLRDFMPVVVKDGLQKLICERTK